MQATLRHVSLRQSVSWEFTTCSIRRTRCLTKSTCNTIWVHRNRCGMVSVHTSCTSCECEALFVEEQLFSFGNGRRVVYACVRDKGGAHVSTCAFSFFGQSACKPLSLRDGLPPSPYIFAYPRRPVYVSLQTQDVD